MTATFSTQSSDQHPVTRERPMIRVTGLTKRYGDRTAVDGLTFEVATGRVTGFVGPNGAGKSTTMRAMVGLVRPDHGEVRYDGLPRTGDWGGRVTSRQAHPAQKMPLGEYVHHRNGTPLGGAGSLRNMLSRSLGARSFAAFWQHWNPVWGYGLGRFVYAPVRRLAPAAVAVLATFVVSGVLHDAAVTAVRRSFTFMVTPWFLLLGIGVLVARATRMDLSRRPWWWRAIVNLAYLLACLSATLHVGAVLGWSGA